MIRYGYSGTIASMFTNDHTLNTTSRIAVAGDWHTDIAWMLETVERINVSGVKHILHVGDFGYGMYGADEFEEVAMSQLSDLLDSYDMQIAVTLGNHENWGRFNNLEPLDNGAFEVWKNIFLLPRGYGFSINGLSFLSLGGAASINYLDLKEGIDWWREEAITMGDIYRLDGKQADIMITHDAPSEVLALTENQTKLMENWSDEALSYSMGSQQSISAAVGIVKPEILFHGHYHIDYLETVNVGEYKIDVVGLHMNGNPNNVVLFDTQDKSIVWL